MLGWLTIGIAILAIVTWRNGGPLRALCIGWLVCLTPVASGVVIYDYLPFASDLYIWLIGGSIGAFVLGTALAVNWRRRSVPVESNYDWEADLNRWWPVAQVCVLISLIGVATMVISAYLLGGQLLDQASLRAQVLQSESANVFGRIGAVTIWACFFSYSFAVYFRHRLSLGQLAVLSLSALGILLAALTSAGRQAPLQLVLLTLFLESFRSQRLRPGERRGYILKFAVLGIATAAILFVTINRTTVLVENKADTFLRLFQAHLGDNAEAFLATFGDGIRDIVTEAMLYLSHTVTLFAASATIDFGGPYFGAINFPFILRQLQPVTGVQVADILDLKIFRLNAERVIGVGWDTSLSGLIMDFAIPGMLVAMALFGYAGQRVITSVRRGAGFPVVVTAAILLLTAAYVPYFSAISDTNIMFLLFACAILPAIVRIRERRLPQTILQPPAEVQVRP